MGEAAPRKQRRPRASGIRSSEMQSDSIRICEFCGSTFTGSRRKKFCSWNCGHGQTESRMDFLLRMAAASTKEACVEWPYAKNNYGYGMVGITGQPSDLVHRVSYEEFVGPLADDECALHSCDNRPCFNYLHIFKGDRTDNNIDMQRKDRGSNKLTADQVRQIRARWRPHCGAMELGREFGISYTHVRSIALRICRRYVADE